MRSFLRFCIAFGAGVFLFTQAIDFIQSEHDTLGNQMAESIMPMARD